MGDLCRAGIIRESIPTLLARKSEKEDCYIYSELLAMMEFSKISFQNCLCRKSTVYMQNVYSFAFNVFSVDLYDDHIFYGKLQRIL